MPSPALCRRLCWVVEGCVWGAGGAELEEWQERVGAGAGVWSRGSSCRLGPLEWKVSGAGAPVERPWRRSFTLVEHAQSDGNERMKSIANHCQPDNYNLFNFV